MKFCSVCDNMYYLKIDDNDENKLLYYCRNCGNEDINNDNSFIISESLQNKNKNFHNIINQYTKFDPTLPRTDKIPCPNEECKCNIDDSQKKEVIYIRYDEINLKYLYLCTICDYTWSN